MLAYSNFRDIPAPLRLEKTALTEGHAELFSAFPHREILTFTALIDRAFLTENVFLRFRSDDDGRVTEIPLSRVEEQAPAAYDRFSATVSASALCGGVFMEAYSVEDRGEGISFHVYCYNAQPGIRINYANGESSLAPAENKPAAESGTYVLNTNSKKIHKPHCSSVSDMSPKNRQDYEGSLDPLLAQGYDKCKACF
jgi:hypothetical protein